MKYAAALRKCTIQMPGYHGVHDIKSCLSNIYLRFLSVKVTVRVIQEVAVIVQDAIVKHPGFIYLASSSPYLLCWLWTTVKKGSCGSLCDPVARK